MTLSAAATDLAAVLIGERLGLDCPQHRRSDFAEAIAATARYARARSAEDLLARLASLDDEAPEWRKLAQLLTVGETYFFRDDGCFAALGSQVLPRLIAARLHAGTPRLRVWSAGCSTGEEAYSLAMLLDGLLPDAFRWELDILGTDVNRAALEVARRGVYRSWSLRATPSELRERYFAGHPGGFAVRDELRRRVRFAPFNLAGQRQPAAGSVDLLFCRNVLMYLSPATARRAITRLQAALAPDGWLVVAPAEAAAQSFRPLTPVNFPGAILFTRERSSPGPVAAAPPTPDVRPVARPVRRPAPPAAAPEPPAVTLERARALADRGQLREALDQCLAVLRRDPLDPAGHVLLAAIRQERDELGPALDALRRALYLDPDCAEAHAALGHLLLKRGEGRRARRHLETAARLGARAET
jgi:chemotaxis protein methyltransferase CheR